MLMRKGEAKYSKVTLHTMKRAKLHLAQASELCSAKRLAAMITRCEFRARGPDCGLVMYPDFEQRQIIVIHLPSLKWLMSRQQARCVVRSSDKLREKDDRKTESRDTSRVLYLLQPRPPR